MLMMCIGVHKCACVLVCVGRGFREREGEGVREG